MPEFHYDAIDPSGHTAAGTLQASSRAEALLLLRKRGLQPTRITQPAGAPLTASAKAEPARAAKSTAGPISLSPSQVIEFTEELADLLGAGLQLEQALHSMESRSVRQTRDLAVRLREQVRDGVPFSTALQRSSPSFGDLYCNLVAAGEASGSLTSILRRQARHLTAMETVRAKVSSALIYPSFIIVSGIALAIVFSTYLLPKLAVLIKNTGGKVPALAAFLLDLNVFLKSSWPWLTALLVAVLAALKILMQRPAVRLWWHRAQLDLPAFGPLLRTRFEVQFMETLGNLLQNGLALNRGLELARRATSNLHLRRHLGEVEALVADGASLSRSLKKTGIVRPKVLDMIRVGEQTGDLSAALEKAAERFDRDLTRSMERVTALIQPVIIAIMALMVGTMAWMMISVVYSTLETLRK